MFEVVPAIGSGIARGMFREVVRRPRSAEIIFTLESLFAGFYVVITRGVTPIFLVVHGYSLQDLLLLSTIAGLLALLIGLIMYRYSSRIVSKKRLLVAHVVERIAWFLIPFGVGSRGLIAILYGFALASTLPTSVYIQAAMLTLFDENTYRRVVVWRGVSGGISSIAGQVTMVLILAFLKTPTKYLILYQIAFFIGILSSIIVSLTPFKIKTVHMTLKTSEEVEVKAANIYLLLVILLASSTLLSISWIPRVINDLGAPDYLAAMIGFIQTLTSIFSSLFWASRSVRSYRYAIILLSLSPIIVYLTPIPLLHLGVAVIYSFSFIGTSLYSAIAYAGLVKRLGVFRAGTLLSSASSMATVLAGSIGYLVASSPITVFIVSSILGFIGLSIALVSIPELAIVKPAYTRFYSRVIYHTSIAGYTFTLYSLTESAKLTLKLTALVFSLLVLYLIYRTLYYIMLLSGG